MYLHYDSSLWSFVYYKGTNQIWKETELIIEIVFLYYCPECPSCPANAIQIGQATSAIRAAIKKDS